MGNAPGVAVNAGVNGITRCKYAVEEGPELATGGAIHDAGDIISGAIAGEDEQGLGLVRSIGADLDQLRRL